MLISTDATATNEHAPDIHGIIPAMVTPFNSDETLNMEALRRLTDYLIAGGAHGLFPTGSQGEFWALTHGERQRIWEVVVETTNGRVPVYAGTGGMTTREVIKLNQLAEQVGVDAVSVITPFFITPNDKELYQHYIAIADATSLPVILYTNPARTGGVDLSVDLVADLSRHPNIIGVKDSSGDLSRTMAYIENTGDDFAVLLGRDTLIYAGLLHGASGAITATANAAPELVVSIYDAFMRGDLNASLAAQQRLAPLRQAFGLGTFPVVVKEALSILGIPVGPARAPVGPMAPEQRAKLVAVLTSIHGSLYTQPSVENQLKNQEKRVPTAEHALLSIQQAQDKQRRLHHPSMSSATQPIPSS